MLDHYTNFEDAVLNDVLVATCHKNGLSNNEMIVALANSRRELLEMILKLESIAPRKITLSDGTPMIWRCPESLIP